ncbi:MAG: TlpA disulfide reductase family protein [Bacteroidota bacterium]
MKLILAILFFSPLFAISQTSPKGFTISGKLSGIADGTDIKLVPNGGSTELAKAKILKGSFSMKGSVKEPTLCYLILDKGDPIELYVENNIITVNNDKTKPGKYIIKGSASHGDFIHFTDVFVPYFGQLNSLASTINSMAPGKDRDGLMDIYNSTRQNIQKAIDKFVMDKPNSVVTPFMLNITSQLYDDVILLEDRFNRLDLSIRNSLIGKELAELIAIKKVGAIGTKAVDFIQPDTLGKPVALSSFLGKYVLVDFWASWCGPCRNENPYVVESFNKFKNKNFTILGVSFDKPGQKSKWIEAINHDSLAWTHVSELKYFNNTAAQLYRIAAIPQNILVDPSGKIVARNLRGPALEAKLCEIFGGCN